MHPSNRAERRHQFWRRNRIINLTIRKELEKEISDQKLQAQIKPQYKLITRQIHYNDPRYDWSKAHHDPNSSQRLYNQYKSGTLNAYDRRKISPQTIKDRYQIHYGPWLSHREIERGLDSYWKRLKINEGRNYSMSSNSSKSRHYDWDWWYLSIERKRSRIEEFMKDQIEDYVNELDTEEENGIS